MTSDLLPCPFCGYEKPDILPQANGWIWVVCGIRCGCYMKVLTNFLEQAIGTWNNRYTILPSEVITTKET